MLLATFLLLSAILNHMVVPITAPFQKQVWKSLADAPHDSKFSTLIDYKGRIMHALGVIYEIIAHGSIGAGIAPVSLYSFGIFIYGRLFD